MKGNSINHCIFSKFRKLHQRQPFLRGGADKFLARSTSQCRRTELIVSLERGFYSCAELQIFSCYRGWKEACQATRAISATSRPELSSFFFPLQGKAPNEIHVILAETLVEYAPSYVTVKNWVAKFKRGDFSTCHAPRPGRPKQCPPIDRSPFFLRRGGYCCSGDLVGRTIFWISLSGLQNLEQRAKKCIEFRGEYVE